MTLDREIAGVTCRRVLAALSEYVDGELAAAERDAIADHLRACAACERFGGAIGAMVGALRRELRAEPAPEVSARLAARLADA